jgi:hypothetical protein
MQNMKAHLEKLLTDAEECALISKLATDMRKRELFANLAAHLKVLADQVQAAIREREAGDRTCVGRAELSAPRRVIEVHLPPRCNRATWRPAPVQNAPRTGALSFCRRGRYW